MTSAYSYVQRKFTKRYPTTHVYAEQIEDKHFRYKAREIRRFFDQLQEFLEGNKDFFNKFGKIMTHKIKTINPENEVVIEKDGFEYVGDTINVYTQNGVFQIRFDIDEKI